MSVTIKDVARVAGVFISAVSMENSPTALFVANSLMTLGALKAFKDAKIKIPEEMSIVGFDDMDWVPLANPPLSAISQPTYNLGVRTAELRLQRIKGEAPAGPQKVILKPKLIIRDSCRQKSTQKINATSIT